MFKIINSIEELAQFYPKVLPKLFKRLNLNLNGLEEVENNLKNNNLTLAAKNLLKYFSKINLDDRIPPNYFYKSKFIYELNDSIDNINPDYILNDIFSFAGMRKKQQSLNDGRINWGWIDKDRDKE